MAARVQGRSDDTGNPDARRAKRAFKAELRDSLTVVTPTHPLQDSLCTLRPCVFLYSRQPSHTHMELVRSLVQSIIKTRSYLPGLQHSASRVHRMPLTVSKPSIACIAQSEVSGCP